MKHNTSLLVAVALLLSVVAIGCAQQAPASPTPAAQTCDKVYDFQCLQEYKLSAFVHLRGWGTSCYGAKNEVPVEECIVSAGYDQQIYTSPDTSTRVKYYTQAQLDACKR